MNQCRLGNIHCFKCPGVGPGNLYLADGAHGLAGSLPPCASRQGVFIVETTMKLVVHRFSPCRFLVRKGFSVACHAKLPLSRLVKPVAPFGFSRQRGGGYWGATPAFGDDLSKGMHVLKRWPGILEYLAETTKRNPRLGIEVDIKAEGTQNLFAELGKSIDLTRAKIQGHADARVILISKKEDFLRESAAKQRRRNAQQVRERTARQKQEKGLKEAERKAKLVTYMNGKIYAGDGILSHGKLLSTLVGNTLKEAGGFSNAEICRIEKGKNVIVRGRILFNVERGNVYEGSSTLGSKIGRARDYPEDIRVLLAMSSKFFLMACLILAPAMMLGAKSNSSRRKYEESPCLT